VINLSWIILAMWFALGFIVGAVFVVSYVLYLGNREIKKRSNRSADWQRIKKGLDSQFKKELERYKDEYGV
jgi:hypothetical protein